MTDAEIAKALLGLVNDTPFQGKDHTRVASMVHWLGNIVKGRAVGVVDHLPSVQEVPDALDKDQG